MPGGLQSLQDSVTALIAKLNKIPFEGIGNNANRRCTMRMRCSSGWTPRSCRRRVIPWRRPGSH